MICPYLCGPSEPVTFSSERFKNVAEPNEDDDDDDDDDDDKS